MRITIKEEFSSDFTTRQAGERLRKMIVGAKTRVILDFNGLKVASASFFDESIGKLKGEGWTTKDFKERLEFVGLFGMDRKLLQQVCETRGLNISMDLD